MPRDICPSRDDAQSHIFRDGRCVMCLAPAPVRQVDQDVAEIVSAAKAGGRPLAMKTFNASSAALRGCCCSTQQPAPHGAQCGALCTVTGE